MNAEFNELLPTFPDGYPQIWIIGTREQVTHQINEFYVKRIATWTLSPVYALVEESDQ